MNIGYNTNSTLEYKFSKWQKSIAVKKQPPTTEGIKLINMALNCEPTKFAIFIKNKLGIENIVNNFNYSIPENELTHQQFISAPYETANEQYKMWEKFPLKDAREPLFWTILHIVMLENSIIKPTYFLEFKNDCDHVEKCEHHREILRRMGGLKHIRGNNTALEDCLTAISWWKLKLIYDAKNYHPEIKTKNAYEVLTKSIWGELSRLIVNRITILISKPMRASLIKYISENEEKIKTKKDVNTLIKETARLGVDYNFSIIGADGCYELTEKAGQKINII